jgi:hypothetical protein
MLTASVCRIGLSLVCRHAQGPLPTALLLRLLLQLQVVQPGAVTVLLVDIGAVTVAGPVVASSYICVLQEPMQTVCGGVVLTVTATQQSRTVMILL